MIQNNLVPMEKKDLAVIDLDITDTAIMELRQRHIATPVTSNKELAIIQKSITELTSYRTRVEKKRKELKADALEFGRRVDNEAKRITGLLEEIEQPLVDVKRAWNEEQERIKAEAAQKEKERVDAIIKRIDDIKNHPLSVYGKNADAIRKALAHFMQCNTSDEFDYQEFSEQAEKAKQDTINKLSSLEDERIIFEREQAAEEVRRQEAEAARIKLEADQEKFREDQRAFEQKQEAARHAEQEKAIAARKAQEETEHAQRMLEVERQKEENVRLAAIEEKRLAVEREQLELDKKKAAHEAKVLADKAQAEYDEIQRKLKEKSLIEQAAPDLLAALEYARPFILSDDNHVFVIVDAAINKARGN